MIRTIKKPQVPLKIKYTIKSRIHNTLKNLKNNSYMKFFELKYNINMLNNEYDNLYKEITGLKNSLVNLKNNYGYELFLETKVYNGLKTDAKKMALIHTPAPQINSTTATTQSLTVINNNTNLAISTKKIAKFSLKSFLIALSVSILNLFI